MMCRLPHSRSLETLRPIAEATGQRAPWLGRSVLPWSLHSGIAPLSGQYWTDWCDATWLTQPAGWASYPESDRTWLLLTLGLLLG